MEINETGNAKLHEVAIQYLKKNGLTGVFVYGWREIQTRIPLLRAPVSSATNLYNNYISMITLEGTVHQYIRLYFYRAEERKLKIIKTLQETD